MLLLIVGFCEAMKKNNSQSATMQVPENGEADGNNVLTNASSSSSLMSNTTNKPPCHTIVIREVYDGINSQERFEFELECALEEKAEYIVIEPTKLGEETSRWIRVGNCLHKTSVLSALASLVFPHFIPDASGQLTAACRTPMAALSVATAALYGISWQFDPCCKYQVTVDSRELSKLNIKNLTNASPVVLVRRDDRHRKSLHNLLALASALLAATTIRTVWHSSTTSS